MPSTSSMQSTVMVAREKTHNFRKALKEMDLQYHVQIDDVQRLITKTMRRSKTRHPRKARNFRYDQYHNYIEVRNFNKDIILDLKKSPQQISMIRHNINKYIIIMFRSWHRLISKIERERKGVEHLGPGFFGRPYALIKSDRAIRSLI